MSVRFIPRVSTRLSYSFTALFCTAAISHRLNRDPPVCSNVLLFLLPFHSSADCIVLARRLPLPHRPLVGDDYLPRRRHVFVSGVLQWRACQGQQGGRFVRLHNCSRIAANLCSCCWLCLVHACHSLHITLVRDLPLHSCDPWGSADRRNPMHPDVVASNLWTS